MTDDTQIIVLDVPTEEAASKTWLIEQALEAGRVTLKEIDTAREQQLKLAQSQIGWIQPVLIALVGFLGTSLNWHIKAGAILAILAAARALAFSWKVQSARNWIVPIVPPQIWLSMAQEENTTYMKDTVLHTVAEKFDQAAAANQATLDTMCDRVGKATIWYLAVPVAAFVGIISSYLLSAAWMMSVYSQ